MYKIFMIEDDKTISSILEEHLKKWGYEVLTAADFSDILPEFTTFDPHLLLMDINLQYYDGFYWCAKIRELNSALEAVLTGKVEKFKTAYHLYNESMEIFGLICYFKQVMAAEEECHQYRMLRRIGMDDKTERRAIRK